MSPGMPLDLVSPARHAATEIERAAPVALSVSDLAETYSHPNTGDISRVRVRAGVQSEHDVNCWLIEQALEKLQHRGATVRSAVQLVNDDGKWRFADDVTFDDLLYDGKKLIRVENGHKEFRDPFDPMSGEFSDNTGIPSKRMGKSAAQDELRDSLHRFGWLRELPGVRDERGVIIIGHRRWALADELEIPVSERAMMTIVYGDGDEADRNRLIAAVVSQTGYKEFTKEEWKRIAQYLRAQGDTIQSIAEVLNKPYKTVQENVSGVPLLVDPTIKNPNRKRAPGGGRKRKTDNPIAVAAVEQRVREMRETGRGFDREGLVKELKAQGVEVGRSTLDTLKVAAEKRIPESEAVEPKPEVEPSGIDAENEAIHAEYDRWIDRLTMGGDITLTAAEAQELAELLKTAW
jgi:hypothetical protein